MGDSRTNFDENSSSKSYTQLTLPQLPQEDNILSHAATKWIEEAETAGYHCQSAEAFSPSSLSHLSYLSLLGLSSTHRWSYYPQGPY